MSLRLLMGALVALVAGACQTSESGTRSSAHSDSVAIGSTSGESTQAVSPDSIDWLIVPGIRVGIIHAHSTEADLKATFGPGRVVRDSVYWFEGDYRPATVLFPDDSIRRLAIVWKDEETWSKPQRISLEGSHSLWRTADGITLGTTVQDLENLNGRPFRITSIDHDYAGLAWSWEDGALQTRLKFLELWLDPRFGSDEHQPLSNDNTARAAHPTVALLYAYFPK